MLIVSASREKSLIHDCSLKVAVLHQQQNEAGNEAHVISPIPLFPLYIVAAKNNFPAWCVVLPASCHLKLGFLMSFGGKDL